MNAVVSPHRAARRIRLGMESSALIVTRMIQAASGGHIVTQRAEDLARTLIARLWWLLAPSSLDAERQERAWARGCQRAPRAASPAAHKPSQDCSVRRHGPAQDPVCLEPRWTPDLPIDCGKWARGDRTQARWQWPPGRGQAK